MINNNMKMMKDMKDLFDYKEYTFLCKKNKIEPRGFKKFYEGMVALAIARSKYPDLDWQEAYIKTFQDMNESRESILPPELDEQPEEGCCGQDKPLPSMSKRAIDYVKLRAIWIKAGSPMVSRTEQLRRLIICNACEDLNSNWDCSKCGCPMKVKVEMDTDVRKLCKEGKW